VEMIETQQDGVMVVEPRGRIDTNTAKPFGDRVVTLIGAGSRNILVDLRQIPYISSAGFRALLIAAKMMDAAKGKFVLCGMSAEIRRLFEIGVFTDLFTICGSRDEGVAKAK
jgi:anti-sigma B factor antagonist